MFKVRTKLTRETVDVYLSCDPEIGAANTQEVLVEYIKSLDSSLLAIPEKATKVVMKPLTPDALDRIKERLPIPNRLGAYVHKKYENDSELKAQKAVLDQLIASESPDPKEIIAVSEELLRLDAEFFAKLSPEHLKAFKDYSDWTASMSQEVMLESIVEFPMIDEDGKPLRPKDKKELLSFLRLMGDKETSDKVIAELTSAAYRLSYLNSEGKA